MKYSEKLRDPRWQKKRLEIMQRDNFTCMACGDKESTLNLHHKEYHGDPWEAPDVSLETLCETCHGERTLLNKRFLALSTGKALKISNFLGLSPGEIDGGFEIVCLQHEFIDCIERKDNKGRARLLGAMIALLVSDWNGFSDG